MVLINHIKKSLQVSKRQQSFSSFPNIRSLTKDIIYENFVIFNEKHLSDMTIVRYDICHRQIVTTVTSFP